MKNLGNLMKQASQMQAKMAEMQAKMQEIEVTGSAGAGMLQVTLNGKFEMKKVKIDKSLVDPNDVEVLEDLLLAAFNDAKTKAESLMAEEMAKLTGGLSLPEGFKLPF
ncbi:nucleoid-associated protein [Paramagnetospirillum marisnigri]|uniref:Nucleoid-associated protein A6A04_11965 n=1 Tax=Paramagnetospirillum marisnigri TaxID=1285242 RepID=A0A178MVR7_9PROT|nr:YbaB/EbfC family nucleoid-associated protein [Paramagnetospirillum marisnigri]OAN54635.1 nucleoid-associated protein [Paramagnetospirillum marisnigri]